jgi:hypothetical protein
MLGEDMQATALRNTYAIDMPAPGHPHPAPSAHCMHPRLSIDAIELYDRNMNDELAQRLFTRSYRYLVDKREARITSSFPFLRLTHSRSRPPASRQRASARCAACRRTPEMPFSSTGPISVKVTSTPAEASTTSWLTRTSPGRAYSAIREARFTVCP